MQLKNHDKPVLLMQKPSRQVRLSVRGGHTEDPARIVLTVGKDTNNQPTGWITGDRGVNYRDGNATNANGWRALETIFGEPLPDGFEMSTRTDNLLVRIEKALISGLLILESGDDELRTRLANLRIAEAMKALGQERWYQWGSSWRGFGPDTGDSYVLCEDGRSTRSMPHDRKDGLWSNATEAHLILVIGNVPQPRPAGFPPAAPVKPPEPKKPKFTWDGLGERRFVTLRDEHGNVVADLDPTKFSLYQLKRLQDGIRETAEAAASGNGSFLAAA